MKFAVTVDDPDMLQKHTFDDVEAADEHAAKLEGVRRAIIADAAAIVDAPPGTQARATEQAQADARNEKLVEVMAEGWAEAVPA